MKVKDILRCITKEADLDITGATLLTKEEAKELPKKLLSHDTWWWTRSPSRYSDGAISVSSYGYVNNNGTGVLSAGKVRPVLTISNLEFSGLKIGDTFEFGGQKFEIISNDKAFCLDDIGQCAFREDWRADDANNYEKSDVKKFIDEWFEKSIEEVNSKENEIKEVNNKNESIYKCRDCRSEIRCPCNPDGDACGFFYPKNILLIKIEESLLEKFLPEENKLLSPQERDVLLHLIEKDLNKRKY